MPVQSVQQGKDGLWEKADAADVSPTLARSTGPKRGMEEFMRKSGLALAAALLALPLMAAAQNQTAGPQGYVFRLNVRRVPVDIVVTDKQGNPVRGLTKKDFVVKETTRPRAFFPSNILMAPASALSLPSCRPCRKHLCRSAHPAGAGTALHSLLRHGEHDPIIQMGTHRQLLQFVDNAQRERALPCL